MQLFTDEIELINFEILKRIVKPPTVSDGIPDPGQDFEGCIDAMARRVRSKIDAVPDSERHDWFIDQSMAMIGWFERNKGPDYVIERASAWAIRLLKYREVRH